MAVNKICDFEMLNSHGHLEGNLNKLIYFQLGGSEKHLRDIAGMVKLNREKLDYVYIKTWAMQLGINEEWLLVLERLGIAPA